MRISSGNDAKRNEQDDDYVGNDDNGDDNAAAAADNDDNRSVFNLLKVVIILSGCCLVAIIGCSTHPQFILLFCLVDYGIYIMTVKYCPVGLRVEGVLAVS